MTARPAIVIIGPGVVGTTLGVLAARAGYRVAGVAGRGEASARRAAQAIGPGVAVGAPERVAPAGGLVLLTVPDDAIEGLCARLAAAGAFAPGAVVAHCSGALGSEVLAAARDRCAAAVGSMHPLQTFPSVEAALRRFPGTCCFCEGDGPAVEALEALAAAIGGRPLRLATPAKLLYHAAAVIACNYFAVLMDAAAATAALAGIDRAQALAALAPLVRATLENVLSLGPHKALTGPIARGDAGLVARQHRRLAAADGALGDLYRLMGLRAIDLAERKGTLDPQAADGLRAALQPVNPSSPPAGPP